MKGITRRSLLQYVAPLALAGSRSVQAQEPYPNRPVRLLVPFPAGALTDSLGRMVAERLRGVLGQPLVVENRPGSGTLLGAAVIAKAPPDGYSLMVATSTTLAIAPAMYAAPPAMPSDLTGVAMIGTVALFLVTRKDLKATNLNELVSEMRNRPGQLNYGSPGSAAGFHAASTDRGRELSATGSAGLANHFCTQRHTGRHRQSAECGDQQVSGFC